MYVRQKERIMGTAAQRKLNNHGMAWIFAIMLVLIVILSITAMIPTYKKYQEQGKRVACATAMDTVLPVIVRATSRRMTVYAFASGLVCSLLVPLLVPLIAGI